MMAFGNWCDIMNSQRVAGQQPNRRSPLEWGEIASVSLRLTIKQNVFLFWAWINALTSKKRGNTCLTCIGDVHRAGETISPKQDWGPGGRDRWFIHLTFYVSFWISLVFLYTKLQPHGPQAWACRTNNTFIPFFSSYSYILASRKVLSHRINGRGQPNLNPHGGLRKNADVATIAFQTFHNFF